MRRFAASCTAALVVLAVAIPVALAHEWAYADSFPEQSFSNSTGSLLWDGPWTEIGESDGPGSGSVGVDSSNCSGSCLILDATVQVQTDVGVSRRADLTGASKAELYFQINRQAEDLPGSGFLHVDIRKVSQGSWVRVKSYSLDVVDGGLVGQTFDVSGFVGYEIELRFILSSLSVDSTVAIDDVEVGIEPLPSTTTTTKPSTTTTSTKPSTTTTTRPATTTTTRPTTVTTEPVESTTTTTLASTTTARDENDRPTPPPSALQQPPPGTNQAQGPATLLMSDAAVAKASGITMDMMPAGEMSYDRMLGLSPLTSLTATFRSVVEAIQNEFLSALGLAFIVAFFAVRLPDSAEEEEIRVP